MYTGNSDEPHSSKTNVLRPRSTIIIHSLYSSHNTSMSSKLTARGVRMPSSRWSRASEPPSHQQLESGDTSPPLASSPSSPSNLSISTGVTARRAARLLGNFCLVRSRSRPALSSDASVTLMRRYQFVMARGGEAESFITARSRSSRLAPAELLKSGASPCT